MSHTEQMRDKIVAQAIFLKEGVSSVDEFRKFVETALTAPAAEVPEAMGDAEIEPLARRHAGDPVCSGAWGSTFEFEPAELRAFVADVIAQWQSTRLRGGVPGNAIKLISTIIQEVENGFVRCENCGEQEDTKTLDFVPMLRSMQSMLTAAIQPSDTPIAVQNIDAAAKALAERMDYPWAPMSEKGKQSMRDIAADVIKAAMLAAAPQAPALDALDAGVVQNAKRYEWLRRCRGQEHDPLFTVQHEMDGTLWGGDLDHAIDAAMARKGSR